MKYTIVLFLILFTISVQAQNGDYFNKKHSVGIAVQPINDESSDPTPVFSLEYRYLLSLNSFLRSSISLKPGWADRVEYRASLGWEKNLLKESKLRLYGGIDLSYRNFYLDTSSFGGGLEKTEQFNLNLLLGLEYSVNNKFDMFIEPSVMSLTLLTRYQNSTSLEPTNLKFLNNTRFGVRYRF